MREVAAAGLLLVVAVAGCIGAGPGTDDTLQDPRTSPVAESHDLELTSDADAASEIWGFVPASGDADGQVTAARLEIPSGSAGMVVAPLIAEADRSKVEAIAYATVLLQRDRAIPDHVALSPTMDLVQRDTVGTDESEITPQMTPLWMPTLAGGEVGIIFAVKADEPIDAGITYRFRSIREVTATGLQTPDRTATAIARLPDEPGRRVAPSGVADGFSIPLYAEANLGGTDGWEVRTGSIDVRDGVPTTTRPMATVRDLTLSSTHEVDSGWTVAAGLYRHLDGVGNWSLDADIHGETIRDQGQFATAEPATDNRSSLPAFVVMNGGAGGSDVAFDVMTSGANLEEHLIYLQLEVAATMETMLGIDGVSFQVTKGTDIGKARLDDDGLTLPSGDVTVRVPGLSG